MRAPAHPPRARAGEVQRLLRARRASFSTPLGCRSEGARRGGAWRGGGRLTQVGGSTLAAAAADGRLGVAPAVEGRIVNLAAEAA